MYPQNTTAAEALSDTKRIYGLEPGLPQFIVAGREVYHNTATGPTGNWTQSGTLKSPGNKFANDWRGSGTFTGYWLLQDSTGKYRGYQLKVPKTISAGETTTVHAVNDFKLVLEE
jgi:hypothetical protein